VSAAIRIARWIAVAVLPAAAFAIVPLAASIGRVAYTIFILEEFDLKFGQWGAFELSKDILTAVWLLNSVTFLAVNSTLPVLTQQAWPFRRVLFASTSAGAMLAVVLLVVRYLPPWAWLSAGPVGGLVAYALCMLLSRSGAG